MSEFDEVVITHIPREENTRADILSKLASTKSQGNYRTVVEHFLPKPSCVMAITTHGWQAPIVDYLENGVLPEERLLAKKLIREAANYSIVNNKLFRRGFHAPLLCCLNPEEVTYVLSEIHEGINGHHMGAKALVRKALRAGYYWPTMEGDSKLHVQKCESCQKHGKIIRAPPNELKSISAPWPFFKWGMDLLGPFKPAPGQLRWLIVAVDYFTKWIEAEPLATITSVRIQKFFEKNIVSRFGIPAEVISDNGTQFTDKKFQEMMANYRVRHHFASVEHPQSNGQAESANKIIVEGLKKRMEDAASCWVEQLQWVLWGYRTSVQTSTGETPFRLTYGCEAMIPVEIGQSSWRHLNATDEEKNKEALLLELDQIDEIRVQAHCRNLAAKQVLAARYNKKVKARRFENGDLVLRRADIGNKNAGDGKLAPNWEGPYRVREKLGNGAYTIETLSGKEIKRTWNADKLKKYYS